VSAVPIPVCGSFISVSIVERFPNLDYFAKRPGRSALIIDDMHLADLSKNSKAGLSQRELADRMAPATAAARPPEQPLQGCPARAAATLNALISGQAGRQAAAASQQPAMHATTSES
jgi:hypothetical protein